MNITVRLLQEKSTFLQSIIDFIQDPSAWMSIISVVIALIALFQAHSQIKLSNKQQLFEKRLDVYLVIEELLRCYRNNQETIQSINSHSTQTNQMLYIQFAIFTSTHSLSEISSCIYEQTDENQKLFLLKLDMLDRIEQEIAFLFPKKEATLMSKFVHLYTGLLMTLYTYTNKIELIRIPKDDKERYLKLLEIYDALQECHNAIVNNQVENKLARIIHL